jgi:acetyl-CoA carboxylase biotin carboxyl carrier protein
MDDPILLVNVESDDDGMTRVLAPKVGRWSSLPGPGTLIGPGSDVGTLEQLHRRFRLVMPEGAAGLVSDGLPPLRSVSVEYGQQLFRLAPVGSIKNGEAAGGGAVPGQPAGEKLAADTRAVVSPTDGVFYRKPSPDAAPFVQVGGRVKRGQPVGLVEVMKTFNQILYDGPGFPEEAEVVEIRAEDAQEIGVGEILIVVR